MAQELLIINIIMSMISYMVLIILLFYVPKFRCEKELYVILSFNIILTSIGMEWLYKALEQYTYITVRSVIFKFIALIFMFFLVHKQTDYVIYGGITIFAASASNILNLINAHKFINLKPVGNYNFRRHLKPVLIFFAMSCATTIYTNLDTVMLGFMTTDTDVGYYNAAVKIKVILVSVVTSLGTVLLPRASYYIQRGELKEFHRITRKALNFVFLMATPLFVYFIYFAKEGIFFLSGNNYVGSIIPMQVIMPTLLLIGITNILGIQILVPTGREKIVLYSEIVGAVVDVIINALDTTVHFISQEELDRDHSGIPHGGFVIRSGKTGWNNENSHVIEYSLKLDSNPEFTSSVIVAYARAAYRMNQEGQKGCKTVFDVAPAYLSALDGAELRKKFL